MASWNDVEKDAPDLAERVRARFTSAKHHTLATLRRDGAPRISGTEVVFNLGEAWLGSMSGARKAQDLQRDPRFALHSSTADETLGDGDARIGGTAVEVTDPAEIARVYDSTETPRADAPLPPRHHGAGADPGPGRRSGGRLVAPRPRGASGHAPVGAEESTVDQDAVTSRFRRSASFNPPQIPCGSRIRTA